MTKSPLSLAQEALRVGQKGLDPYSCKFSRKDFTQAQIFSLLVLRQFFRADYRKITKMVQEWSDLRQVLEIQKVPHWTTLQKAESRLLKKGLSKDCSGLYSTALETVA
jgi:hypothetical protein